MQQHGRERALYSDRLSQSNYPGIASLIDELKKAHPNWTFTILYTGLDWNNVIYNETEAYHGRSLVQNSNTAWICPTCGAVPYDSGSWYCASNKTVSYYMDIRNWLTENYIFAFETLSYDSATQTIDGVRKILSGTFMDRDYINYYDTNGNLQTIYKSYAQIIMEAAAQTGVSPYHLASRVKLEQGKGTSGLISGTCTYTDDNGNPLRGYYNYFNIGASGSGEAAIIKNGLTKARANGWTSPELSIKGGAKFLGANYIKNYQDCLYLQKYQVDSAGGLYSHQYMQNVSAPYSEGYTTYQAYRDMGMLDYSFNFIIPVYENMPMAKSSSPNSMSSVSMDIVTDNVMVTTSYSALKIRETPSNGSNILGAIEKGTIILRIEKATAMSADGRYWDKVCYDTGSYVIVGYSARTDTDGAQYLTPIGDVITVNEEAITTTDVNLRNGPGLSSTTVKRTLPSGVNVTIIDKMQYPVNDYYWYRVKLSDGSQGYMASTYLTNNTVSKDNYKIDGEYIKIAPETRLSNIEGATTTSTTFGTGAIIELENNSYKLVMLGDVSGDGTINSADLLKIVKHLNETAIIQNEYLKSADCNDDGAINSADLLKIVKYLNETGSITL